MVSNLDLAVNLEFYLNSSILNFRKKKLGNSVLNNNNMNILKPIYSINNALIASVFRNEYIQYLIFESASVYMMCEKSIMAKI